MTTEDRRWLIGLVCGLTIYLAGSLLFGQRQGSLAVWSHDLGQSYWLQHRVLARKNVATGVQALGALVTFFGLANAYVRAKYDETVWKWITDWAIRIWRTLLRKPRDVTIHAGTAHATFGVHGYASGYVTHNVDITLPLQEQIKRLADFVNRRSKESGEMGSMIRKLQHELEQVKDAASGLRRDLLAHIEAQIKQLDDRIDGIQALDLTWAIWGLLISFVGTVLSFGT